MGIFVSLKKIYGSRMTRVFRSGYFSQRGKKRGYMHKRWKERLYIYIYTRKNASRWTSRNKVVGVARVNPHGAPTPWKIRFQEVVLALRTIEFNEPIRCKMHEPAESLPWACLFSVLSPWEEENARIRYKIFSISVRAFLRTRSRFQNWIAKYLNLLFTG